MNHRSTAFLLGMAVFLCGSIGQAQDRFVTVTGQAAVMVAPDEVILTVGVETSDLSITVSKSKNDEVIEKIIAVGKRHGLDQKHIQTDYLNIEPRYENTHRADRLIGYFARKSVVLTIRDLSVFESLLSDCLEAGATHVHGVDFRTTELRKFRDEARALAIKAAREKASDLSGTLGKSIGDPLEITEGYIGLWSWYGSSWGARWSQGSFQNTVQNYGGSTEMEGGTLAPGQVQVTASVNVKFELKP